MQQSLSWRSPTRKETNPMNQSPNHPTDPHPLRSVFPGIFPDPEGDPPCPTPAPAPTPASANGSSAPAATTAQPETSSAEKIVSHREAAYQAVTKAGILSAELYNQLGPFAARPSQEISLSQIAAYLALAAQMHQRSGEAIAALADLQAEIFSTKK